MVSGQKIDRTRGKNSQRNLKKNLSRLVRSNLIQNQGQDLGVSKNRGIPKSSILIGFSLINHPFWGTTIFGNTHLNSAGKKNTPKMPKVYSSTSHCQPQGLRTKRRFSFASSCVDASKHGTTWVLKIPDRFFWWRTKTIPEKDWMIFSSLTTSYLFSPTSKGRSYETSRTPWDFFSCSLFFYRSPTNNLSHWAQRT